MALYLEDMDRTAAQGCCIPGCEHKDHDPTVFLHARCHMDSPCEVSYTPGSGALRVQCHECKKLIAEVAIASKIEKEKEWIRK